MSARTGTAGAARRAAAPISPWLTDYDLHLLSEGTHYRAYDKLGAHVRREGRRVGTQFAVWAPNARAVSVVGDFNGWRWGAHPLRCLGSSGFWEGFVPGAGPGALYKFAIESQYRGYRVEKADPYAFSAELRPQTASRVWELDGYAWGDAEWMASRATSNPLREPIVIYEVHLGSWMRAPEEGNRWLSFRELAPRLADYASRMGFTHVELLPVTEHPFDGSWGYQTVGYFAPTSRFGTPEDFMALVDTLHRQGIGIILDWAPAHFPGDEHGLAFFDGTHLYEHADPRRGTHPDWDTRIFNYGRREVANFLLNSALFWLDTYHVDGLRVDAVASMLYLDYSREAGEWTPNQFGGREDLEAIALLRRFNELAYARHPGIITVAEESTAWPMVSRPTTMGGLGFGFKWDMGWMHDTLVYFGKEPVHRRYHQNDLTFRMLYAFTENFILPLSHDEVVHGKGSLLSKMPGDPWQQHANLRLLLGYQYTQPGKKLLFAGAELGQRREWSHDESLDWHLLHQREHAGLQRWVRDLNACYREQPALHALDAEPSGFEWIDCSDADQSILCYLRKGPVPSEAIVAVCNFTPVVRHAYRVGVPWGGRWEELLNSDAAIYGGSSQGNFGGVEAARQPWHGRPFSVELTLPPLGIVVLKGRATTPGRGLPR
jgi:1,4-alpha-glucan branching enzyme